MSGETPAAEHETEKERVDRELIEFLNEVRVVLPGVQVLFAFLLTLPFTGTFKTITGYERFAYILAFFSTALAAVLMITPTSFHRLRFRKGDKEQIIRTSNRLILAGIACLGVAIVSVVWLVSELLFTNDLANAIAIVSALIVIALWLVLPLQRRFRHG
jgi:O-antigen/teichoic acid export membrane protein